MRTRSGAAAERGDGGGGRGRGRRPLSAKDRTPEVDNNNGPGVKGKGAAKTLTTNGGTRAKRQKIAEDIPVEREETPFEERVMDIIEPDEQDEGAVFKGPKPLLMPSILEHVFTFLPLQTLKDSRLVCQLWNDESNRCLGRLKTIKIDKDEYTEVQDFLKPKPKAPRSILSQLECKEITTSHDLFEKLVIYKGIFLHQLTLDKCTLKVASFLNLMQSDCFPNLGILMLKQTTYVDEVLGRKTIFIPEPEEVNGAGTEDPGPMFKQLKILEIDERGADSGTTLRNIAKMCPGLVKLTFSNCPIPILSKTNNPNLSSLEYLQLAPIDRKKMEFQYFEALVQFKLTKLKVLFLYGMTPGGKKRMQALRNLLKAVSPTLQSLHLGQKILYVPEFQPRAESPFPVVMPNLAKMTLGPGFVNSLKVLDKLPLLNSFTCTRMNHQDWNKVISKGLPSKRGLLGNLDLGDIGPASLRTLAPSFPNLSRLELNLTRMSEHNEIFQCVFEAFPFLQMFNVYDLANQSLLTDSGIIGISNAECTALMRSRKTRSRLEREGPYIGNMKHLMDLRLQNMSSRLTDLSVLYGIKELPCLFALDLSKSLITDASLKALADSSQNLSMLYLRECKKVTQAGINAFRLKRPNVQLKM